MNILLTVVLVAAPVLGMKLLIVWVKRRTRIGWFEDVPTKGAFTSMFDMVGIKYRVPPES
jgi:hypothetical protein